MMQMEAEKLPNYLYCRDEQICNILLSKNMKLLNTIPSSNEETWVFEYNPGLFSLDFNNIEIKKSCHLSEKLIVAL